jgi:putative ABC transport system permease protein
MQWFGLALRNILRNKRRSFVTLIAIAVGFTSISVYYGYIDGAYNGLRNIAMKGEGLGHLRINRAGWQKKGKLEPEKYMFSREETEKIIKLVMAEKGVILATPQLQVTGMVSNGSASTVFIAQGLVPGDVKIITGDFAKYLRIQGEKLSEDKPYGIEMASDLSRYLKLFPGRDGVVMAQTLGGQMNVMDMQVRGIYNTGNDFSNDKFMRFNFSFAQSLLNTQSTERVVILLKDWRETERMRTLLLRKLKDAGIDCEVRAWNELSLGYSKMKSYLDTIFLFLFSIVLVVVLITTINTMAMAVYERTREIGTLRALGFKFNGLSALFAREGALLGFCGSIVGIMLHTLIWAVIKIFPPRYTPPGFSVSVPVLVNMVPLMLLFLVFVFVIISTIAAIIPARRAAKKNIVDALGHV